MFKVRWCVQMVKCPGSQYLKTKAVVGTKRDGGCIFDLDNLLKVPLTLFSMLSVSLKYLKTKRILKELGQELGEVLDVAR